MNNIEYCEKCGVKLTSDNHAHETTTLCDWCYDFEEYIDV